MIVINILSFIKIKTNKFLFLLKIMMINLNLINKYHVNGGILYIYIHLYKNKRIYELKY